MKRKLLFAALCVVSALGFKANAQNLDAGTYYLYNVEAGKYVSLGANWGTRSVLSAHGVDFNVTVSDGKYTLVTKIDGATKALRPSDGFMDQSGTWEIVAVGDGTYKIKGSEGFFRYDGSSKLAVNGAETDNGIYWEFRTKDALTQKLSDATVDNPVDATHFITAPDFWTKDYRITNENAWTGLNKYSNGATTFAGDAGSGNTLVNNTNAQSWNTDAFDINQTLKNLPAGVYKLSVFGFYRAGTSANAYTTHADKTEALNAILYAGANEIPLMSIMEEAGKNGTVGTNTDGGIIPNTQSEAASYFEKNLYVNTLIFKLDAAGDVKIGVKKDTKIDNDWTVFDNFDLQFYGAEATIADVMFGDLNKQVKELRATATELKDNPDVPAANVTALNKALDDTKTIELTTEAYEAAITTLTTTIGAANAFVIAKPILAEMKKVVDATNFYTAEACETYYGQWAAKYDAGTLTLAEAQALQNPTVVTDWHASITVDNFLLSAWDTNPDFNNAPYYINSWSTEGNGDGSNFRVPFFEYWTGDANSLGVRTLSGTMTELPAGYYKVTAWVRVRANNNNVTNPKGVTMQLNEALPLDVTTGGRVGESNFYLKEFTAYGKVGADGKLIAKFNVEAGNTISWLSFKNVKYATATEAEYREYLQAALAEGIEKFNIWKEQAEALAAVPYLDKYEAEHTQLNNVITTQTTAVGNAETAADIEDAIAAVKKAMKDYVFVAEPQEGEDNKFDLTFLMTNPDLTNLPSWQKAEGWTTEQEDGNYQVMDNDKATSEDGTKTKFYEYWSYNAKDNDKFNLYNKITLTKGTYTMTCYAFVKQQDGEAGKDPKEEVYFYANETQGSKVTTERLTKQEISFFNETENPDGVEVKIGLKPQAGNTYNWMGIGYVELYKEFTDWHEYDIAQEKGEFTYAVATANGSGKTSMAKKNVTVNVEMPEMEEGEEFNIEVIVTQEDGTVVAKGNVNAEGAFTYQQPRADVTVTVARETKEIAMEFYKPSDDRYKYAFATFIAPFNVDIAEYSKDIQAAYTVDDVTDGELDMTEVEDGIIPAYTPVILECKKMKSVVPVTFTDNVVKPTKSAPYTEGLLTGVLKATDAPVGTYVLQEQDDQLAFYQVDKEKPIKVPAYKAYLTMPGSSAKAIFFPSDEEETAIKTLDVLTSGYDAIYTANGVQVNALQKGLNIVKKGGKSYKIFVK